MNTFIVLSTLLVIGCVLPTSSKAISKDEANKKENNVEIPEELYNLLQPMTKYYFNKIIKLVGESQEKSNPKPPKMKKISKALYKAAVSPMMNFYKKNMKTILPLGHKSYLKEALSKPNDPRIQQDNWTSQYQNCLTCCEEDGGTDCMFCSFRHNSFCCQ